MNRDASLDTLLALDGSILVIDEAGYWVKMSIRQVAPSPAQPHGLDYELTLHGPRNARIAGFDNAHPVPRRAGPSGRTHQANDHKHRFRTVAAYDYSSAEALLTDFWVLVESVMKELGVWK